MEQFLIHFFHFADQCSSLLPYLLLLITLVILYLQAKKGALDQLTYRRYFSAEGVFEGSEVYLIEEVSNHSFLPLLHLDIESRVTRQIDLCGYDLVDPDGTQHFISRFTLLPFTTIQRRHKAICRKRGVYTLETALTYFLKQEHIFSSPATLHVYPKPLAVEGVHRLDAYMQSMDSTTRPILDDPFCFSGIRQYAPGDPFRSINFKATARHGGSFYVNKTDYVTGNRQMLYLNFEPDLEHSTDQYRFFMETALSFSTYLLERAFRQGSEIGFCANSQTVSGQRYLRYPMSRGLYHYEEILKQLSCIRMLRGQSLASLLHQDVTQRVSNTEFIILTLTCDDHLLDVCEELKLLNNQIRFLWLDEV